MDHNQILLDAVIEFPSQLLVESSDGLQEGSLLLSPANQLPISNQNMVEMGKKLLEAASENDLEAVRALMTGGAPFTGNWLGTTPLHAAAKAGHIETVELLLKAGIFRDAKTKVDRTALQMAAEEGYTEIVQMLLEHGADINAKDMLRMTALHWAVERGHRDVVTVLLAHGADITVFNKFDKTAMDIACDNCFEDIALQLEAATFQKKASSPVIGGTLSSESVSQNTMHDDISSTTIKSPTWKTSPEEDALEKLTASAARNSESSHEALKLLESHGISFLPVDNSTLLTSALESGQSISLTEAGKMALNQMKKDSKPAAAAQPVAKKLKPSGHHPRVVTITAEQFLALAGRLQQQGKGQHKPMIISLPKNLGILKSAKPSPPVVNKEPPQLDPSLSEFVLSQEIATTTTEKPVVPLSMPILTEEEEEVNSTEFDLVSSQEEEVSNNINPASSTAERKNHFFKSGLLKGSARTTPMPLLCMDRKKPVPVHQPTLNNAAPPLDADDDMFVNDESHSSTPPVWLSIMEEENSQFDNDDDLLDPSRLAAQLASIRQAASQYSFSS